MSKTKLTILIEQQHKNQLQALAKEEGRSMTKVIEQWIKFFWAKKK